MISHRRGTDACGGYLTILPKLGAFIEKAQDIARYLRDNVSGTGAGRNKDGGRGDAQRVELAPAERECV